MWESEACFLFTVTDGRTRYGFTPKGGTSFRGDGYYFPGYQSGGYGRIPEYLWFDSVEGLESRWKSLFMAEAEYGESGESIQRALDNRAEFGMSCTRLEGGKLAQWRRETVSYLEEGAWARFVQNLPEWEERAIAKISKSERAKEILSSAKHKRGDALCVAPHGDCTIVGLTVLRESVYYTFQPVGNPFRSFGKWEWEL